MKTMHSCVIGIFLAAFFTVPAYSLSNDSRHERTSLRAINEKNGTLRNRIYSLEYQIDALSAKIDKAEERVVVACLHDQNTMFNALIEKSLTEAIASIHEEVLSMTKKNPDRDG
ncbi:MAG: hypothetical protein D3924_13080 [Candidatus Electrothrix sp. AR4]|nr:hypothetical protein [Candidatus Electrothrix sp. AR4]